MQKRQANRTVDKTTCYPASPFLSGRFICRLWIYNVRVNYFRRKRFVVDPHIHRPGLRTCHAFLSLCVRQLEFRSVSQQNQNTMKLLILASLSATVIALPLPNSQVTLLAPSHPTQQTRFPPSSISYAPIQHHQNFDVLQADSRPIHIDIIMEVTSSDDISRGSLEEMEG